MSARLSEPVFDIVGDLLRKRICLMGARHEFGVVILGTTVLRDAYYGTPSLAKGTGMSRREFCGPQVLRRRELWSSHLPCQKILP